MTIVKFFQSQSSSLNSFFANIFNFVGSLPMFVVFFAIIFLFFCKQDAYKFSILGFVNFVFGALILKNIFGRLRPLDVDQSLFANRSIYPTKSLPSLSSMNVAGALSYTISKGKNLKKYQKTLLIFSAIFVFALVAVSKIYYGESYLTDILLGGILGVGAYFLVFFLIKKIDYKFFLFFLIVPALIISIYFDHWFVNGYTELFEVCGFFSAVVLGSFLEEKFVKCPIKNNLIFSTLKGVLLFISLILCYFLNIFLLSGVSILSFLGYFITGIVVTLFLPFLFKICEKYCFVFSKDAKEKNVVFSKISLSLNGTKKIAKAISKRLKAGDTVLLEGDLGAGKSVVVRDILKEFGVENKITSPTFTLVNDYFAKERHYYHFDMYRIENEDELKNIGFEDIIDDKTAIKFVEWPSKIPAFLPKNHFKKITIVKLGKNSRNIILEEIL